MTSGDGGRGGSGRDGDGGYSDGSAGGGVYDGFGGTLELFGCTVSGNVVRDGEGGSAGPGPGGRRGSHGEGTGGGLSVAPDATAYADADTAVFGNHADGHRNVAGRLGTI